MIYGASAVDLCMWGLVLTAAILGIKSAKQETSKNAKWFSRRARVCVYVALLFGIGRLVCSFKLVKELSRIIPKKGDDHRHEGFKEEFDPATQGRSTTPPEIIIEDYDEEGLWTPWDCYKNVNFIKNGPAYNQISLTDSCEDDICDANPVYGEPNDNE